MTQRFRLTLVAFAALGALVAAATLLRWGGEPSESAGVARVRDPGETSGGGSLTGRPGGGDGDPRATVPGGAPLAGNGAAAGGGLTPGLRTPHGLDLSTPALRRAHLLALIEKKPTNWEDIAAVVEVSVEGLEPAVREFLLAELRAGDRNGANQALIVAHDPALVPELLVLVDDPTASVAARRVALRALSQMPGANRDDVVKQLESRLTGKGGADGELLGVIARRGGREAARAVLEYLARGGDAVKIANSVAGQLDLITEPAVGELVAEAFSRTTDLESLSVLVRIATARPGAAALAAPLIALDRDGMPEDLRVEVLEALAQVGTEESLGHLLQVSRQPGTFGERATLAIANLPAATPAAREALVAELERVSLNPRPDLARAALLEAVGTLRVAHALPLVVKSLSDPSDQVKNGALRSLGRMGELSRPHVDEVAALFATGTEITRMSIVQALGDIRGPKAAKHLESFLELPDLGESLRRSIGFAVEQAREQPQVEALPEDPAQEPR